MSLRDVTLSGRFNPPWPCLGFERRGRTPSSQSGKSSASEILQSRKRPSKEGLKLSTEFDPVFRFQILKGAADVYLQLKDQDEALKTIAEGAAFAQQLYAKDADSTTPNLALKAQWPSTNFWRQFVGLAARVSPDEATRIIDEVPDPEIHAFLRVALASSLMGQEPRMVHPVIRNQKHEVTAVW